jgi:hypothetical protein
MTSPREPGTPHGEPVDLPSAEELFGPDRPARSPGELSAILRHSMGETDRPPELARDPYPDGPDVSELRRELGL